MRAIILAMILSILLIFVVACRSDDTTEPMPPVIHYGEDICEFCGMIISDERYAAGYLINEGEARIFDDIGGMFISHLQTEEEVIAFFVHDYEDTSWIRAETAHYVLTKELPTPMLYGLVACATPERAEALAAERDGSVLTFDEVMAHYREIFSVASEDEALFEHPHSHQ